MGFYALLTSTPATLTDVVTKLGQVFTGIIGFVGTVASTVVDNPLLMLFLGIGMTGTIIGVFKRLLHS